MEGWGRWEGGTYHRRGLPLVGRDARDAAGLEAGEAFDAVVDAVEQAHDAGLLAGAGIVAGRGAIGRDDVDLDGVLGPGLFEVLRGGGVRHCVTHPVGNDTLGCKS